VTLSNEQEKAQSGAGRRAGASQKRSGPKRAGKVRTDRREGPLTVFIHIPKTAGTTLVGVFRNNFPPSGVRNLGNVFHGVGKVNPGPVFKLRESAPTLTRDIHLLGGHIPFGVHAFLSDDTRYVTFLRNPVERTLSHYYRLLEIHRKNGISDLPEQPSLEQLLTEREYLYDNLQTRMLSDEAEPFGEVTDEMLEQAKENLASSFVAFGLADRFDESLVLLKRGLGLKSIVYVSQRMTTERPRTRESKAELVPIAERFNSYDLQLYEWASSHFERTVSEQDELFAVELAALKAAVSNGQEIVSPPPALSKARLWEEAVRARAELLGWEFDAARARAREERVEDSGPRATLQSIEDRLERLTAQMTAFMGGEADEDGAGALIDTSADEGERKGRRRVRRVERLAGSRPQKEANLEKLRNQISALEGSLGDGSDSGDDPHVLRELERLRGLAAEAEEELERQDQRTGQRQQQAEKREAAQEERQAQAEARERQRKITALVKLRDSSVTSLEDAERRLVGLREMLHGLQPGVGEEQDLPERRRGRLARLQENIAQKETQVEQLRERVSAAETELNELNGGEPVELIPGPGLDNAPAEEPEEALATEG
jgi:hypothetical protein